MSSLRLMVASAMAVVGGLTGGVVAGEDVCVEPVVIGVETIPFSTSPVTAIDVVGDFAYVIDIRRNLTVFDISDVFSPVIAGHISLANNEIASFNWDVEVVDGLAYLVNWGGSFDLGGLKILDVSDPASITQVGKFDTQWAMGLEVSDSIAYIMNETNLLQMVSLSDPEFPVLLGTYVAAGVVKDAEVVDGIAYLVTDGEGLVVVDVTDAAVPVLLGSFAMAGKSSGIEVVGSVAIVANEIDGLVLVDVLDPAQPSLMGSVGIPNGAWRVSVSGDVAHVLSLNLIGVPSVLWSIGVDDPGGPVVLGSFDGDSGMDDVLVRGDTAFLAAGSGLLGGILILDVTNSCSGDCAADMTGDGELDFFDISAFLTAFGNGDLVADFSSDGVLDFFDVSGFLVAFGAGCP